MSRKYEEGVERLLTKRGTDRKAAQTDPSHLNKGPRNLKKAQVKKTQRERESQEPKQRAMTFANSLLLLQVISSCCLSPRGVDD